MLAFRNHYNMKHYKNFPLKKLTSFKQSGEIKNLFVFNNLSSLQCWLTNNKSFIVIGNGSNVLFNPETFSKPLIKLTSSLTQAQIIDSETIRVPAAFSILECQKFLLKNNLGGLEFSSGVPASIGGMVAMNFSCWQQEMANIVKKVKVLLPNGNIEWWPTKKCQFSYRNSKLLNEKVIIIEVELAVKASRPEELTEKRSHFLKLRQAHQPLNSCCFGSVFKNPSCSVSAGKLIENANLKAQKKGEIMISDFHANFLVNLKPGKGLFQDALDLIKLAEEKVYQETQIRLSKEVVIYD